jgi:hypothetical protein
VIKQKGQTTMGLQLHLRNLCCQPNADFNSAIKGRSALVKNIKNGKKAIEITQ